jgi:catecholate siderophore receptor
MEGAWFRTEKDNAHETRSDQLQHIVAAGNQLVKGVQFSVVGRLPQGMDLVAGYAYLDSAVIYSQFFPNGGGLSAGQCAEADLQPVCHARAAVEAEWGLGSNYVGSRTASSTVPYVPTGYAPIRMDRVCGDQRGDETGAWILGISMRC